MIGWGTRGQEGMSATHDVACDPSAPAKALAGHGSKALLDIVQAVPLSNIFATTEAADAYIDQLQRDMLQGSDGA